MKKTAKRFISLLLAALLSFGAVPMETKAEETAAEIKDDELQQALYIIPEGLPDIDFLAPNAAQTTPPTVTVEEAKIKLESLVEKFEGKFFTVDGNYCAVSGIHATACDNCLMSNVIAADWVEELIGMGTLNASLCPTQYSYKGTQGSADGYQCFGFANFAHWYIFAEKNTDKVVSTLESTGPLTYETIKNALPGDVLRSNYYSGHSMIFISCDEEGFTVLDSNHTGNADGKSACIVKVHKVKYNSKYTVAITGVQNYDRTVECEHEYSEEVTEPTCTEQGYTTYTCELCGDYYVGDYVEAAGHSFDVSFACNECGYKAKVSVLGDSISTYSGVSGVKNAVYPNSTVKSESDTWWKQVIDIMGGQVLKINASGGSRILSDEYFNGAGIRDGNDAAYRNRCINLHVGEDAPDIIFVFMGTNDFSYHIESDCEKCRILLSCAECTSRTDGNLNVCADCRTKSGIYSSFCNLPLGTAENVDVSGEIPDSSCEAYAIMLSKMQTAYPNARIYCLGLLPRVNPYQSAAYHDHGQPTSFNAELKKVADDTGATFIDLEHCLENSVATWSTYFGDAVHPTAVGMDKISEAVVSSILGSKIYMVSTEIAFGVTLAGKSYAIAGNPYDANIIFANDDIQYDIHITMSENDITETAFDTQTNKIRIDNVTGEIKITIKAKAVPEEITWYVGAVNSNNGSLVDMSNRIRTNMCDVTRGAVITAFNGAEFCPVFYDKEGNFVYSPNAYDQDDVLTIPAGQYVYMRLMARNKNDVNATMTPAYGENITVAFGSETANWSIGTIYCGDYANGSDADNYNNRIRTGFISLGKGVVVRAVNNAQINVVFYDENFKILPTGNNCGWTAEWSSANAPAATMFIRLVAKDESDMALTVDYGNNITLTYGCIHDYKSVTTPPTCTEQGYATYTCSGCGDSYEDSYTEAHGHIYSDRCDKICNICGAEREIYHDKDKLWSADAENHWHACTCCKTAFEAEKHTFTEGICSVCTYEVQFGREMIQSSGELELERMDISNGDFSKVGSFNENTGEPVNSSGYKYSEKYYDISEAEKLFLGYTNAVSNNPSCPKVFFYDENHNYISMEKFRFDINTDNMQLVQNYYGNIIEIPENAEYARFATSKYTTHLVHYFKVSGDFVWKDNLLSINNLRDKTVVFFGDSIIGNYSEVDNSAASVSQLLEKLSGAETINGAFGGTWLSKRKNSPYGAFSMVELAESVCSGDYSMQYKNMAGVPHKNTPVHLSNLRNANWEEVDYIIIGHGTNDFKSGVPIENANDRYAKNTLKGALRFIIETINDKYPHIQIVLCTVNPRFKTEDNGDGTYSYLDFGPNRNGDTLEDYANAFSAVAEEYDLVCVDLYNNSFSLDNADTYFNSGDGTHPNLLGRWKIAEKIVEKLGHNYEQAITLPTCTEQGYTTYTCTVCGDSYVGDYVDATGHSFSKDKCEYCGIVMIRVYAENISRYQGGVDAENGTLNTTFTNNWYSDIDIPQGAEKVRFLTFKTYGNWGSVFMDNYSYVDGYCNKTEGGQWVTVDIPEEADILRYGYLYDSIADQNGYPRFEYVEFLGYNMEPIPESQYMKRPATGCHSFNVKVNIASALGKTGEYVEGTDYGYIMLPTSYKSFGEATRLIIICHGASAKLSNYKSNEWKENNYSFWTELGYAVMDMYACPEELSGDGSELHYGNPAVLECYKKGYEYVMEYFNLKRDGIFVIGSSMGGLSSFQIVQSGEFPVIAQVGYCPVIDIFKQAYVNPWSSASYQRSRIAQYFGFEGTKPAFTNGKFPSDAEIGYFRENLEKVIEYSPIYSGVVSGNIDDIFGVIPDYAVGFSDAEAELYGKLTAAHPCPVMIFHNLDDSTVSYRYSEYFKEMVERSGQEVLLHTFETGGHNAWDNGSVVSVQGINKTLSLSVSKYKAYEFFKGIEDHSEHYSWVDPAVSPTCTENGLTEGSHCAYCGEVLVVQEVVPATGHTYENGICTACGAWEHSIGDINLDGTVNVMDAYYARLVAAKLIKPTDEQITLGDVDSDGKITAIDANIIRKFVAGVLKNLPV